MLERQTLQHSIWVALLLVLAVVAVFLPVVGFDFIIFDDPSYVTGNLHVMRGLTWNGVVWAFHGYAANWHPATWVSHMLDCQLYGLNPAGHHLTNLVLHAANSVLLFLLLRYLTGAFWRSAFVAALFALHPLHVESVAWVAERKDVLSAFFGLLSLWAYAAYAKEVAKPPNGAQDHHSEDRSRMTSAEAPAAHQPSATNQHRRTIYYLLSLCLFALSLMSKAMLVTWPGVMLLLDFWPLRRFERLTPGSRLSDRSGLRALCRLVMEKLPFFALSAAGSVVTFLVQKSWGAVVPTGQVPLALRMANVPVNYARYLGKMLWPTDLAVVYPYVHEWPSRDVLGAGLVLVTATLLALWQWHKRPYFLMGWLWYLGTLIPVIGLVQAGNQSIADRYAYLPAVGMLILLAWGVAELVGTTSARKVVAGLAAAATLTACALLCQAQVLLWQNTETVFRHALSVTTNNFVAYSNLGFYYAGYREHEQAIHCYRAALAVQPTDRSSWNGLAMALINQRKYQEAVSSCQAALQLDPGMALAHGTLGLALMKLGKTNEALGHYSEALRLDPDLPEAHYNLANALAAESQIEPAREHYAAAARLNPGWADAHNNLAYMLVREGKFEAAAAEFQSALALESDLWQAHYGLAGVLLRQGKIKEAVQHYRQTLDCRPALVEVLNRLAWILATNPDPEVRHGTEAVRLAEQACQLTQFQQASLLSTLAAAFAEAGRLDEATNAADKAYRLALAAGQMELARRSQQLLELFRSGRSYHETVQPPPEHRN